jgi:hypothetical protein
MTTTLNGKPIDPAPPAPKPQDGTKDVHGTQSGAVGQTGEHGDLGTNAKS